MSDQVTIVVDFNNPVWVKNKTYEVEFEAGETIHDALRTAYDKYHASDATFTFDVRYSGKTLGTFLQTLCGIPTTPSTSWEIFVGEAPATKGIDTLLASPAERVRFVYVMDKDELRGEGAAGQAKRG